MTRQRGELNAGNNDFKDLDALKQRLSRAGEKDTTLGFTPSAVEFDPTRAVVADRGGRQGKP